MDRNTVIGMTIIFALLMLWAYLNSPTEAEIAEQQRIQDSLEMVQNNAIAGDSTTAETNRISDTTTSIVSEVESTPDSVKQLQLQSQFGPFAESVQGEETFLELENDKLKVTFSNKGARITNALLKEYYKIVDDEERKEQKVPLNLLEDKKNKFEYILPVPSIQGGQLSTADLYFEGRAEGNSVVFKANVGADAYVEQIYTLKENTYELDYDLHMVGMDKYIDRNADDIELNWINYLDKLEKNDQYERMYSTVYFKPTSNGVDYCNCRSDDSEDVEKPVKWVSHANQFFNASLIADESFRSAFVETVMLDEENEDLKLTKSRIKVPIARLTDEKVAMTMYVGPNEFKNLAALEVELEDVIPFGWSIFGTINRWIIRPIFNFLSSYIANAGLVILILTLIVKLLVYPLTYRMLYSQSKMGALKPEMAKVKERYGEDQQKQQMETMKLYREFGVNPLGGCFPIFLQMPLWFALYRFFPASIEFRQASFLWATDLSSYDEFIKLSFDIPFYGDHVSLFTLLWAGTTVIYTYYNSRHMDMSVNPAMKYMQYFMPIMFLFFFNNFAAGLTCYLLFSNILNITQTLVTKNYIIDQEKIKEDLHAYKKKPKTKKKKGFQERLEQALKEQQRIAEEKQKKTNDRDSRKKK